MISTAFTSKWLQNPAAWLIHKKTTKFSRARGSCMALSTCMINSIQKLPEESEEITGMWPYLAGELYTAGSHYQPLHNSLDLLTLINATSARGWLICICFGRKGNHVVAALHFFFWKVRRRWLTHSWPPVLTVNRVKFFYLPFMSFSLCHLFSLGTAIEPSSQKKKLVFA